MMSSAMHAAWCTVPTRSTGLALPLGRVLPQVWKGLVRAFRCTLLFMMINLIVF